MALQRAAHKRAASPVQAEQLQEQPDEVMQDAAGALRFDEPPTWRAGMPIPLSDLLRRVETLYAELQDIYQGEKLKKERKEKGALGQDCQVREDAGQEGEEGDDYDQSDSGYDSDSDSSQHEFATMSEADDDDPIDKVALRNLHTGISRFEEVWQEQLPAMERRLRREWQRQEQDSRSQDHQLLEKLHSRYLDHLSKTRAVDSKIHDLARTADKLLQHVESERSLRTLRELPQPLNITVQSRPPTSTPSTSSPSSTEAQASNDIRQTT